LSVKSVQKRMQVLTQSTTEERSLSVVEQVDGRRPRFSKAGGKIQHRNGTRKNNKTFEFYQHQQVEYSKCKISASFYPLNSSDGIRNAVFVAHDSLDATAGVCKPSLRWRSRSLFCKFVGVN